MPTLEELARTRNQAEQKVIAWMRAEGQEGRLRYNDQCPHWAEYTAAQQAFQDAAAAVT